MRSIARYLFILGFIVISICITSCDFAGIFKKSSSSNSTTTTTTTTSGSNYILSYKVTAANNSSYLTTDYTAVITGTNIYITLPYSIVENSYKLTPTVSLESGYTITPSGSYVLSDGLSITLVHSGDGSTYTYTLHVSVDASTVSFLHLANPFYYDSSGTKTSITSSEYTLTYSTSTKKFTITLNTDTYGNYGVTLVSAILNRPIGFDTVTPSYYSASNNLTNAIQGTSLPYTVQVADTSGNINTYTITGTRTKSSMTSPVDITYTDSDIIYKRDHLYYTNLAAETAYMASNTTSNSWYQDDGSLATGWMNDLLNCGYTFNAIYNTSDSWNTTPYSSTFYADCNQATPSYPTSNALTLANTYDNSTYTYPTTNTVDNGTSLTINSTGTYTSQTASTTTTTTVYLNGSITWYIGSSYAGSTYWRYALNQEHDILYTPMTYYQINSITVHFPSTVSVNYSTYDSLCSASATSTATSTINTSCTDSVYTFTIVSSSNHLSGDAARFTVTAEDGTTSIMFVTLE